MILTNDRCKDLEDVGVLFHAILRYGEANEEQLDRSIASVGYAVLLNNAELAATTIAAHHEAEGEDWDGVVWYERLADTGSGSLAEALYSDEVNVLSTVADWLDKLN